MIAALDFEQPFPFGAILVPPVRLAAGRLYFRPKGPLHPANGQPERLVFDFAGLSEASEKAFLEFSRKWGALGICPHGTTLHHRSPPCLHLVGDELVEPIAGWRGRARYVRSTLNIRTALNRGQTGSSADWRVVWPGSAPKERSAAAAVLGLVASTFLSEMNAQPILQCVDQRLTFTFIGGKFPTLLKAMTGSKEIAPWLSSSGTLLAEIAVRTALALQEGAGWAICSNPECRRLYRPRRHVCGELLIPGRSVIRHTHDQKLDHRAFDYHSPTSPSPRIKFSVPTGLVTPWLQRIFNRHADQLAQVGKAFVRDQREAVLLYLVRHEERTPPIMLDRSATVAGLLLCLTAPA